MGEILLRLMAQPINRMKVKYLPLAVPTAAEKDSPALFCARVRGAMATALGIPATQHAYEDSRLMTKAAQLGEPPELVAVRSLLLLSRTHPSGGSKLVWIRN